MAMLTVATDERCSVSLSQLRDEHDIVDLLDYFEMIDFIDESTRPEE